MIVLKYQKCEEARFISHIDLLRHISRILLRAEIPVKRSNGFNPHALVFFSHTVIEYQKKGEPVKEDVTAKIFSARDEGGMLCLRLATGGVNLRPDRLLATLDGIYGETGSVTDIVKTAQFASEDGEFVNIDDILS